jgi:hypothetical protein
MDLLIGHGEVALALGGQPVVGLIRHELQPYQRKCKSAAQHLDHPGALVDTFVATPVEGRGTRGCPNQPPHWLFSERAERSAQAG